MIRPLVNGVEMLLKRGREWGVGGGVKMAEASGGWGAAAVHGVAVCRQLLLVLLLVSVAAAAMVVVGGGCWWRMVLLVVAGVAGWGEM
jgi:hypothetical protein